MSGTATFRIVVAAVLTLSASLTVTGCFPISVIGPSPSASKPTTTPSSSPDPSPSPTVEAVPIPTDCALLVSAETYASTFATRTLNDPLFVSPERSGVLNPTVAPPGSSDWGVQAHATQLYCVWSSQDPVLGYRSFVVSIGTLNTAFTDRFLSGPQFKDYTCEEKYEGRVCQVINENSDYDYVQGHTVFARDGVLIDITQENFPTHGVLGEMVTTIWG